MDVQLFGTTIQINRNRIRYIEMTDGVRYAPVGSVKQWLDNTIMCYDGESIEERLDNLELCDSSVCVLYNDGSMFHSGIDDHSKFKTKGIVSAVYECGYGDIVYYNATPTVENDEDIGLLYGCQLNE